MTASDESSTNLQLRSSSASASAGGPGDGGNGLSPIKSSKKSKVVYLHTFPPTPHVYNISPFAIKVESFLRLNGIPYEMVYTMKFGSKGQMPYIKLDGEEIDDSNVIIPRLKREFGIEEKLSPHEMAVGHAFIRMIEEHTAQLGFYYRYGLNMQEFLEVLDVPDRLFQADKSRKGRMISNLWGRFQPGVTMKKTKYRGLARHTDEEKWSFSNDDLRAVSDYLADKPYLFGEEATTTDCALFGHLVQFLYIPLDFPQKEYLHAHCPNVVKFVERFRSVYWKDWENKCERFLMSDVEREESMALAKRRLNRTTSGYLVAAGLVAVGATTLFRMSDF